LAADLRSFELAREREKKHRRSSAGAICRKICSARRALEGGQIRSSSAAIKSHFCVLQVANFMNNSVPGARYIVLFLSIFPAL
jgi:hypothetical protein